MVSDILPFARKKDNYEKDATGATALWPTTQLYKALVPTGKRWFFVGGTVSRAQSSTLTCYIKDSSNDIIRILDDFSAATGISAYPSNSTGGVNPQPVPYYVMDVGDYIALVFGTAQDANSYASCQVWEIDI